jgi:REP element-mobilizing transposase RayT
MSNHLHMLCGSSTDSSLSNIMRDFKTFTSKAISREIEEGPIAQKETILNKFKRAASGTKKNQVLKVWQNGFHPKELRTNKFIYQKLRYIHMNPVKKGLVDFPEEYEFSSGSYYAGNGGLLDVIVLSPNFRQ